MTSGRHTLAETMTDPAPENLRVRFRRTAAVTDDTWTHVRCQIAR